MAIRMNGAENLGDTLVTDVYHGSGKHFESLADNGYHSVGIHFGDIEQAKHFAGSTGQILRCHLRFKNLFDVKKSDLGWTSEILVAMALKRLMSSTVGIIPDAFDKILKESPSSSWEVKITNSLSGDEAKRLVSLLDTHGIDGIKYTNKNEPPGRTGGTAYFVLRKEQVEVIDRDSPVSGKFESKPELNPEIQ